MRRRGFGTGPFARVVAVPIALPILLPILAAVSANAQSPPSASLMPPPAPVTGFVPPYEILRTVRAAGFNPLAPPLREGTTYVLRATDFRGILMRVLVDARTGAIRDAIRIVPGPGFYGLAGYARGDYGSAPYGPRVYDPEASRPVVMPPASDEASADDMPLSQEMLPPDGLGPPDGSLPRVGAPAASSPTDQDSLALPPHQQSAHSIVGPPLPRPRPAIAAAAKPSQDAPPAAASVPDKKPDDSTTVATTAASTAPKPASPSAKPAKGSGVPAIND